jgi:hypothetical protein
VGKSNGYGNTAQPGCTIAVSATGRTRDWVRSMTRLLLGAAVIVGLLANLAFREEPVSGAAEYIQIRHGGEEDHPSIAVIIVPEKNSVPDPRPLRSHYVVASKGLFASVAKYVVEAKARFSESLKEPPMRGTFEITWRVQGGGERYIVPPRESCRYLRELSAQATREGKEKAAEQIHREIEQTMGYVSCGVGSKDGTGQPPDRR